MAIIDVPSNQNRRSIRLRGYDYAQPGAYFVTLCTHRWINMFGGVSNGEMMLNPLGLGVQDEWLRTAKIRPYVQLDEYVIMPNHLHGIVMITDNGRGVLQYAPNHASGQLRSPSFGLGAIIRGFKSVATRRINCIRGVSGQPIWQRNYYEHIIRDDHGLNRIREYITYNPHCWHLDKYNPAAIEPDEFDTWLSEVQ